MPQDSDREHVRRITMRRAWPHTCGSTGSAASTGVSGLECHRGHERTRATDSYGGKKGRGGIDMNTRFVGFAMVAAACLHLGAAHALASNTVKPGDFVVDPPTLINLGFEWFIDGDDN